MSTGRRSLIVGTIVACLLGGLLTVGVVYGADQKGRAAEYQARAAGDLQRLGGLAEGVGGPMGRVASFFEFLEQRDCAGGVCQQARQSTEEYLRARAELIRRMLEAFLASDGADDGAPERQEFASLHADFTAEMAAMAEREPMLATLPDILATTLSVPDYLEAPRDDTNQ
jgi:hypothetical protein